MVRIVPGILLHCLHSWRSDVGSAENAMHKHLAVSSVHLHYNLTDAHKGEALTL